MGVYGLQKFMRENCKNGYELVSLPEIAKLYRFKTGKKPVLLYDLKTCLYSVFTDPIDESVCGGLKKLKKEMDIFINDIYKLGIDLKVVTSGIIRPQNLERWTLSCNRNVANLENFFTYKQNKPPNKANFLPFYMVLTHIFQASDKCEFIRAEFTSEEYFFNYSKTSNCFAILTNDSQYISMEGAEYCLSLRDLNRDTMITYNYNRNNLAKCLNISTWQLPLFGSLYFGHVFEHSPFYEKYIKNKNFHNVTELIKKLPSEENDFKKNLSHYGKVLQMNEEDLSRWTHTLNIYFGYSTFDVPSSGNEEWNKILSLARQRHVKGAPIIIYEALIRQEVFLYSSFSNVLKPQPGTALLSLREEIYGILFFEHPNKTTCLKEYCFECREDISKTKFACKIVRFPLRNHPGLLKMWTPSLIDIQENKLNVFCRAIDSEMNPKLLKDIQEELLFPFFAVYYLYWISEIKIQKFEVKILLVQAVLANSLSEEEIENFSVTEINRDAYSLSSWFVETIIYLNVLNSVCGDPFCVVKTNLINYFDGKVLQYIFKSEMNGELKENNVKIWNTKTWKMFKFLEEKFYAIGKKCGHNDKEDEDIWRKISSMRL